jgi:hypothetical protein
VSNHIFGLSIICSTILCGITFYFYFSIIVFVLLLTFVVYVVIFCGVVPAALGSACFRVFGSVSLNDILRTCCYLVFVSCTALNIGLCVFRLVSFICRLFLLVSITIVYLLSAFVIVRLFVDTLFFYICFNSHSYTRGI